MEPIAIIGIGCRFPGRVNNPKSFWHLLQNRTDAITDIPESRFDIGSLYHPQSGTPGKVVSRQGGFLQDVDQFDALFFGISPREAADIDPQQRLLLETSVEALEDAGIVPSHLAGTKTSVFVGLWTNDYEHRLYDTTTDINLYVTTGSGRYAASGRLSYFFDLRGPSLTIDTACSSSLVAVHLACQSIWNKESILALAGGVNLILQPHISIGYSRSFLLSPESRCKFGDAAANGYVRSEGAGVVVLKPLSHALADNDPIYAVIRGSAVTNDGQSGDSLANPGVAGQLSVLRTAYRNAGVEASHIHYIEAHGTGTSAGDSTEIRALGQFLNEGRPIHRPCLLGSVKTNIGHTEAAAGIAGLIKVALILKHRIVPASLHFRQPNPTIPWTDLPLHIVQEQTSFITESISIIAGVSSFGITGTNAHVVLEEYPLVSKHINEISQQPEDPTYLLPISAKSEQALQDLLQMYQTFLSTRGAENLYDLCYTASIRREHYLHRATVLGKTKKQLIEKLNATVQSGGSERISIDLIRQYKSDKLVFVFPGQGSQWHGMGRQLFFNEPVFRSAINQCEKAMRPHLNWSLVEQLFANSDHSQFDQIDVIQPIIFAIQVGLCALWQSWGIKPAAVIGHSMGEIAAAHVAGMLSLEDAARIICVRSRLLKRMSGHGAMAVVELTREEAQQAIIESNEKMLSVAISNSPRSTVLAGDPQALQTLLQQLQQRNVFFRYVKVDVASHSPQMEPLLAELNQAIADLVPHTGNIRLFSPVNRQWEEGHGLNSRYWTLNLREPVYFSDSVQQLLQEGYACFLEISPHPVLLSAIGEGIHAAHQQGIALPSLHRDCDERQMLLTTLSTLYIIGCTPYWSALYPYKGSSAKLPTYPWQKEYFWLDNQKKSNPGRQPSSTKTLPHPLLGEQVEPAAHDTELFRIYTWNNELSPELLPFLQDHRVQGLRVLPAAGYIEMLLTAAQEVMEGEAYIVEQLELNKMLVFTEGEKEQLQIILTLHDPEHATAQVLGRSRRNQEVPREWISYVVGKVRRCNVEEAINTPKVSIKVQEMRQQLIEDDTIDDHDWLMSERKLQYGPSFRCIKKIWIKDGHALAYVNWMSKPQTTGSPYKVPPFILDAAFQTLLRVLPSTTNKDTYVPISFRQLRCFHNICSQDIYAYTCLSKDADIKNNVFKGNIALVNENGKVFLEIDELCVQRINIFNVQNIPERSENLLHEIYWQETKNSQPPPRSLDKNSQETLFLFVDKQGIGEYLATSLLAHGQSCVIIHRGTNYQKHSDTSYTINPNQPEEFRRLVQEAGSPGGLQCKGMVFLWSLIEDQAAQELTSEHLVNAQKYGTISVLYLVQALAQTKWRQYPRLWLVTRNTQNVPIGFTAATIAHAPLWGLARTIAYEYAELNCTCVDISSSDDLPLLFDTIWESGDEDQIVLRGQKRYTARLTQKNVQKPQKMVEKIKIDVGSKDHYSLYVKCPGLLSDFSLIEVFPASLNVEDVEIQIHAAGLNFIDLMKAMGVYPGVQDEPLALGLECAGIVTRIGQQVHNVRVGEPVIAIALGCLGSHVVAPAQMVFSKPANLNFDEAAGLPIAFLTAFYALYHLAHLQPGERILIHSASGGVGLAALQLAQNLGAEIFTTAGTEEKRAYLRSLGISHVMDSRSLDFAQQVLDATQGKGIDVVLNSLTGEAITMNLKILAPYGRFLEIGKKDIYQDRPVGLWPFHKNLSYFAIDLLKLLRERVSMCSIFLHDILSQFSQGTLHPLPHRIFPINEVAEGLHFMSSAKHIGKVIFSIHTHDVWIEPRQPATILTSSRFPKNGSYLISGGLGALGLLVSQHLVQHGARHLVLLGRNAPSANAQQIITQLEEKRVHIQVVQADVSDYQQVEQVINALQQDKQPLKGIFHLAGQLNDGMLIHQSRQQFEHVMSPKVFGAWNLHRATRTLALDYFVLFSSVASLLGSPGQGNYAAANAFLDALAIYRCSQGLPGLSINWGPWARVGLAAEQTNRGERIAYRGLRSLEPEEGLDVLDKLVLHEAAVSLGRVGVFSLDIRQWCQFYPQIASSPLLKDLQKQGDDSGKVRSTLSQILLDLAQAKPDRFHYLLTEHIREQISKILSLAPTRIDKYSIIQKFGFDSLMAIELRNMLEANLGLTLPSTIIWTYPTINDLATHIAERLQSATFPSLQSKNDFQVSRQKRKSASTNVLETHTKLDQFSDVELATMLTTELEALDEGLSQ